MTAHPTSPRGAWTGFETVNGDDAAANTAATGQHVNVPPIDQGAGIFGMEEQGS